MKIYFVYLLLTALNLMLATSAAAQFRAPLYPAYPEVVYLGAGVVNDLVGPHIEVANPVGSVWILVGKHLDVAGEASFEQGRSTGFVAGIRFFSGGRGLQSGWYGGLVGGTLEVDIQQEKGQKEAYQRLGFGVNVGYQFLLDRLRVGAGLGIAYLEPYTTNKDERIERDYQPMVEATLGLRF